MPDFPPAPHALARPTYNTPVSDPLPRPELHPLEAAERQRALLVRILRMAFFVMMVTVTLLTVVRISDNQATGMTELGFRALWWIPLVSAVALFVLFVSVDLLTPRKKISTLSGVFVGMLAGILATVAVGLVIDVLAEVWGFSSEKEILSTTKILLGIALSYLCISTVLQTQDDFRLVIPYVEFSKQVRGPRPLLLDSSALIDARVVDLASTGIIQYPIVIPRFVINELQTMADSQDRMKRAKGRRGLDVIAKLQRSTGLDVSIDETPMTGMPVDQMLVDLAQSMPATLVSADVALNRIAGIQGVKVLNLNEVANALKPAVIPGEQLAIRLLKPGEQRGQAVGYLDDGTMVVAEDGADHIGQRVTLNVTSTLQTSAGRLIFGRIADGQAESLSRTTADSASNDIEADSPSPREAPADGASSWSPPATQADGAAEQRPVSDQPRGPFPPRKPTKPNPARNPRR